MTAALASAKADIRFDRPKAEAKAEARSSVEINDSCNCFKFCLPCFGKKKVKVDARRYDADRRAMEAAHAALAPKPSDDALVRSPRIDNLSQPHVTVDIHYDSGNQ